ncbi:MAG: hypothetical protein NT169_23470 [Chloroflexi bacterium]|nr:hypothetical protein [Chloroflexota bacterium]
MTPPDLIPNGVPLASVPGLTAVQIQTLSDAWIVTAQELVALCDTPDEVRNPLMRALGVDGAGLDRIAQAAQAVLPATRDIRSAQLSLEASQADYRKGALLDEPPEVLAQRLLLPRYAPPSARRVVRSSVSLLDQLPPIRDQGGRGTCVAHAVTAVREQLEITAGGPTHFNLSEQFVYWWCKGHDGIPTVSGTYVAVGMRCLNQMGAPLEQVWPYASYEQAGNEGEGPAPAAAADGDPAFRTLRTQEFNRADITGVKTCLSEGRAVAFSIPVFDSWYDSSATRRWGKITLPVGGEREDGGHAMTLVGYQDDATAPGGGYFLVRNSWQPWSYDGVWREGYGVIPYAYITRHASAVFSAERVTGSDVYVRDSAADTGMRPLAAPTWNSPDVWLRQTDDGGTEHQAPLPGQANAFYVRGHNRGPAYAYDLRLSLYAAPLTPTIQPADWVRIGRLRTDWVAPGETILGPITWTPPDGGRYAFQARLDSSGDPLAGALDPTVANNVGERRGWLLDLAPGATAEVAFDLAGGPEPTRLAVERGDLPAAVTLSPIVLGSVALPPAADAAAVAGERSLVDAAVLGALTGGVMLLAGAPQRGRLTVTLPADAPVGAKYAFGISQVQGDAAVGRLNVEIRVTG